MTVANTAGSFDGKGRLRYVRRDTHERVFIASDVAFIDDFVNANAAIPAAASPVIGFPWVAKIVGAAPPTVAYSANAASGQVACTLTSASQKQDAALTFNDQLTFDVTKGLIVECASALTVLPSAASVQAVWDLSSAWIDGPDNASYYLEFGATANGAILCRSQDGVNQKSVASGITVLAGVAHIYRIDATDLTDVKFYIDGVQVSTTSAIAFAATGANAILQPYASVYKPSGTGVATLAVDAMKVWTQRS